jgi:hypothetical protein
MTFKRLLGLAILIVGVVLLVFGINSSHAFNEKVVESVQGHFTNKTTLYIIGGIVCIIVGSGLTFMRRRS